MFVSADEFVSAIEKQGMGIYFPDKIVIEKCNFEIYF